jgi:hypothetical protein
MNKLLLSLIASLALIGAANAQTNQQQQQTEATSVASGQASNEGNNQNITFTSPQETKTSASVTTNTTNTTIKSGTDRSIVEYQGDYTVKNVPSVNGPNLTTSNDTCMGSTSGSVNGPGFGVGIGTTWTDEHCKNLKMSRELWNKGMKAASLALDCENAMARKALEMTGTKCPQSMTADERRAAFGAQASVEGAVPAPVVATQTKSDSQQVASTSPVKGYTGNDPIVLKRLSNQ